VILSPFSAPTLLVLRQKGHPACKSWVMVCWWVWVELCTSHSSSCHHSPPPSSLATLKSGMQKFWYRLTQDVVENGQ